METHELIQDVRKLVRSGGDDQADAAGEEAEDIIEDVAQAGRGPGPDGETGMKRAALTTAATLATLAALW